MGFKNALARLTRRRTASVEVVIGDQTIPGYRPCESTDIPLTIKHRRRRSQKAAQLQAEVLAKLSALPTYNTQEMPEEEKQEMFVYRSDSGPATFPNTWLKTEKYALCNANYITDIWFLKNKDGYDLKATMENGDIATFLEHLRSREEAERAIDFIAERLPYGGIIDLNEFDPNEETDTDTEAIA